MSLLTLQRAPLARVCQQQSPSGGRSLFLFDFSQAVTTVTQDHYYRFKKETKKESTHCQMQSSALAVYFYVCIFMLIGFHGFVLFICICVFVFFCVSTSVLLGNKSVLAGAVMVVATLLDLPITHGINYNIIVTKTSSTIINEINKYQIKIPKYDL